MLMQDNLCAHTENHPRNKRINGPLQIDKKMKRRTWTRRCHVNWKNEHFWTSWAQQFWAL